MSYKESTGLRNGLLVTGCLKNILSPFFVDVYSGTEPATADDSIGSAVLLCTYSNGGNGLTWASSASNGVLTKNLTEVAAGTPGTNGTGTFWRMRLSGDSGAASTTAIRAQGSIGLLGAEMQADPAFANGVARTLSWIEYRMTRNKESIGLLNKLLDTGSFRSIFNNCRLSLYNGTLPENADAGLSGATFMGKYTVGGDNTTPLTFASTAVNGTVQKTSSESWRCLPAVTGVPSFFRLEASGDTGAASETEARIQGSVAQAGADLNLLSLSLTSGVTTPILNFFAYTRPTH